MGLVYIEGIAKSQGKEEKVRFLVDSGAFLHSAKERDLAKIGIKGNFKIKLHII